VAGAIRGGTHASGTAHTPLAPRRAPPSVAGAAGATLALVSITERIQTDLATAAKARDRERLAALRLVLDALKKAAKEARGDLDEQGEIAVLKRERKRRLEAAEAYRGGGREELATAEEKEAEVIQEYLPEQISDTELDALVSEAINETGAQSPGEIGKVMGVVMPRLGGRADGRRVSELVREKLVGSAATSSS
jgi:uncharacterized protein